MSGFYYLYANKTWRMTHHTKSVKVIPEFRLPAVVRDPADKYLLRFIAITFSRLLFKNNNKKKKKKKKGHTLNESVKF